MSNELIELELEFLHHTDDSVLIKEGKREIWIPKKLCENYPTFVDDIKRNSNITMKVQHWYALKEGLI